MRLDLHTARQLRPTQHAHSSQHTHLLRFEAEVLKALQKRRARQRDVALALLGHPPQVQLDVLDRLPLALMYQHRPR